jgi:hypothetical protein
MINWVADTRNRTQETVISKNRSNDATTATTKTKYFTKDMQSRHATSKKREVMKTRWLVQIVDPNVS